MKKTNITLLILAIVTVYTTSNAALFAGKSSNIARTDAPSIASTDTSINTLKSDPSYGNVGNIYDNEASYGSYGKIYDYDNSMNSSKPGLTSKTWDTTTRTQNEKFGDNQITEKNTGTRSPIMQEGVMRKPMMNKNWTKKANIKKNEVRKESYSPMQDNAMMYKNNTKYAPTSGWADKKKPLAKTWNNSYKKEAVVPATV